MPATADQRTPAPAKSARANRQNSVRGSHHEKDRTCLARRLRACRRAGSATGEPAKPYEPGLVEFMMTVQSHHAKLWLAGNARNWELADYQVDELKELLEDIAKRIPDLQGRAGRQDDRGDHHAADRRIEAAIKARDGKDSRPHSTSSRRPATPATRRPTGASSSSSGRQRRHSRTSHSRRSENRPHLQASHSASLSAVQWPQSRDRARSTEPEELLCEGCCWRFAR